MRPRFDAAVCAILVAALTAALSAKGETIRLRVVGPGLSAPIDVTDPAALANVWAGTFIGPAAQEPDHAIPRYVVTFLVRSPRQLEDVPAYRVVVALDRASRRGFVYLPGPGEEGYRLNVRTMQRDGQDGHWHYASLRWTRAIVRRLCSSSLLARL